MPKNELLIQLIVDGRPGWQIRQPVTPELCRKMSGEELAAIGASAVGELSNLIKAGRGADRQDASPVGAARKKR